MITAVSSADKITVLGEEPETQTADHDSQQWTTSWWTDRPPSSSSDSSYKVIMLLVKLHKQRDSDNHPATINEHQSWSLEQFLSNFKRNLIFRSGTSLRWSKLLTYFLSILDTHSMLRYLGYVCWQKLMFTLLYLGGRDGGVSKSLFGFVDRKNYNLGEICGLPCTYMVERIFT